MKWRWAPWLALSAVAGAGLCWALLVEADLGPPRIAAALTGIRAEGVVVMTLLTALGAWLSAQRWRMIAGRPGSGDAPAPVTAFSLTAMGVGLGQILPVQVATALTRALGGRLFGERGMQRAAGATLYEQSFDLALMLILAVASALAILVRQAALWPAFAAVSLAGGLLLARALLVRLAGRPRFPDAKGWRGRVNRMVASGALQPELVLNLFGLSAARFAVLVATAAVTCWRTGLDVPILALAVALPVVALAGALPLTPAGLGVTEWTFTVVLSAFGVPLEVAALWAVINRLLVAGASVLVGLVSVAAGAARGLRFSPFPERPARP